MREGARAGEREERQKRNKRGETQAKQERRNTSETHPLRQAQWRAVCPSGVPASRSAPSASKASTVQNEGMGCIRVRE